MIERPMPQDVLKYKAKLIGNFSARQIVCLFIAVVIVAIDYFLYGRNMSLDPKAVALLAFPAVPVLICGFMPIMGMPAEKIAVPLIVDNFIAPAVRKKEIHFPEYEKYAKMNFVERESLRLKLEQKAKGEEVVEEDNKKKKKKKPEKFKVKKSAEYKGIK